MSSIRRSNNRNPNAIDLSDNLHDKHRYVIDWNFDEDRCRMRTGYGPENVSRLRRLAIGAIHFISDGKSSIAEKMRQLHRNTRLIFDYLRMTKNSTRP